MKKHIISLYIKEVFITPGLYIAILAVAALTFFSCTYEANGGYLNMTVQAFVIEGNFTKNIYSVVAVLPMIATFCDDCKHQYLRPIVARCGVRKYAFAKFIASALSAYLVVAGGILLATGIMATYTPITESADIPAEYSTIGIGPFKEFETMGLPALTFITQSLIFSAYAAVYALMGLVIAAFIQNKFLTYASPFALSFIIAEIGYHATYAYNFPKYLNILYLQGARELFEQKSMLFNAVYDLMFAVIIAAVLYFIFRYAVEKRVKCEIS